MAENDAIALNENAFNELRRLVMTLRERVTNHDNRLAQYGVRRHEIGGGSAEPPIKWQNVDSTECPAYGVVRITGYTSGTRTFTGAQPNTTLKRVYLVNGPTAVPANSFGKASWLISPRSLPQWRKVAYHSSDGTPAEGEEWGPAPGQWTVRKYRPGLLILGGPDTTNTTVLGLQSPISSLLGKTDASHAKAASGTVSVWVGTAGSEVDSTINVTAHNRFAAVASGKWVHLTSTNGQWYLDAAEC